MIVPFVSLLLGLVDVPQSEPVFAFNKDALMSYLSWNLQQYKEIYGVFRCLAVVSILYVLFSLLSNTSRYLSMYFLAPIRNGIVKDIRNDMYHKITILPLSFFSEQRKGDILSRFSSDMMEIEWSVMSALQMLLKDILNIIVFASSLIFISPKLFLFVILIFPITVFFIRMIGKSLKRNAEKGQKGIGLLLSNLEETLSGMRIIQAFNIQDKATRQFRNLNENYTRSNVKALRRKELSSPITEILGVLVLTIVLLYGGNLVFSQEMQAPVFIAFVVLFSRIIPPAQGLVTAYNNLQKGNAAADRVFEIMDAKETILEKPDAIILCHFEKEIRYQNVYFAYKNNDNKETQTEVLKNIDLAIPKGKTIAIVGPSGAGKTTLVDLLPRFYDCSSGSIFIDNISVGDLNINSLRASIGLVSQDCILFNDSIINNIAFGLRNVALEEIIHAAKIANAHEFIEQLPNGYYTNIGDRGLNLSGGQRQRISIARAIFKDPPILILDEATSALDTESEKLVQDALSKLMENRTSIVIAHRLSTILHADEIIVMEHGCIVERGKHETLVKANGLYKKLVDLQSLN